VARNIARKYRYRGEPPQDLEQVASVGLILAVDRFDPGREINFLSFAVPTITGEVLRHFRDRTHTIRVPRRLRELQSRIHDATAELVQRHGRAARPSEIARHLGLDVEVVLEGLAAQGAGHPASLDEPARHGDEGGGSGDRARFAAALGRTESEFDLVEHVKASPHWWLPYTSENDESCCCGSSADSPRLRSPPRSGLSQMHVSRLLTRTLNRLRRQLATDWPPRTGSRPAAAAPARSSTPGITAQSGGT
jgi:RNA polymerase sigma-B factor